jgi:hypothetical protein
MSAMVAPVAVTVVEFLKSNGTVGGKMAVNGRVRRGKNNI